jgi:hypothetical protein
LLLLSRAVSFFVVSTIGTGCDSIEVGRCSERLRGKLRRGRGREGTEVEVGRIRGGNEVRGYECCSFRRRVAVDFVRDEEMRDVVVVLILWSSSCPSSSTNRRRTLKERVEGESLVFVIGR